MTITRISQASLDARVVGRTTSLFDADVHAFGDALTERLAGRRVLVVGGGGSIGSQTVRQLLRFQPSALHVMDISENSLAELVRDIRSSDVDERIDLKFWPIDFGGAIAERLIRTERPYEIVLNFAALKHVRSEKDIYSLLQMLDTNVVRQARFKRWITARGDATRYFSVSTDKAANPTSLMGASKRLMEDVLFGLAGTGADTTVSARFANVAFSNGSLLLSWLHRIALGQPVAVPTGTRRYFVTLPESGQICLLASLLGTANDIFIPRLDPAKELRLLDELAAGVLELHGYEAVVYHDEAEARAAVGPLSVRGQWPLLVTPLDTSGEKPFEEFVGGGETVREIGLSSVLAVRHAGAPLDVAAVQRLEALISDLTRPTSKSDLVAALMAVIPGFHHVETGQHLDQRM